MKRLDELFNNARNAQPPLSQKEAENIITGAAIPALKTGKGITLKKAAFITLPLIIATIGIVAFLNTGGNDKLTELTPAETKKAGAENLHPSTGKQDKNANNNPAISNTGNTDNRSTMATGGTATDTPVLPKAYLKRIPVKTVETRQTPISLVPTKAVPAEKAETTTVPTGAVPTSPIKTEALPIISSEETPVPTDSVSSLNTIEKTDDSAITATTSTTAKKPEPPERFPRILVKTDLVGFFHNSYQSRRHTNYSGFDAWPYWGNRVTLGGELLFSRRLSWEITGTYGFPYGYSAGGAYEPGKPSYDLYKNYKGWIFSTGIKYFIIKGKNAGAGLYIGPYASVGYLQERVLYFERNTAGENKASTISVSKGRSVGYGAFAGYRVMYRNWFIEPQGGLIIDGKDKGYYNQAYFGQESWRYGNLWRIEFSAGYKF